MTFSSVSVDYDGTLSNPAVALAVAFWAISLSATMLLVARQLLSRNWRWLLVVPVALLAFLETAAIQERLAALLLSGWMFTSSVGFFGSPPAWPAQACAAVALLVTLVTPSLRRKAGPDVPSSAG